MAFFLKSVSMAGKLRLLVLVAVFLGLQLRLWQPSSGLLATYLLRQDLLTQTQALAADETRNQALVAQLQWLQNDKSAIEHHARASLGMIKPGETFYVWVEKD